MNNTTYKYISEISENEFKNAPVLPFKSEDGRPCILIRNSKNKTIIQKGTTDNIEYHLNSTIEKENNKYCFHVVSCIKNDDFSKEQFNIAYEYLFKKIKFPLSDIELAKLISSLEQLFKITPEEDRKKLQIGVFGELLFLKYIYDNGYKDILKKYHSYFYSKHDVEIDSHTRIEIKSTVSEKRIHNFGHDQLYRKDINVYVASLILEYSQEGLSLYKLFKEIMDLITDPEDLLDMGSLKSLCKVNEIDEGPKFSYNKSIEQIKIFKSENLPHLSTSNINGVTNISYDVDCALAKNEKIVNFINLLNNLKNNE